MLQRFSFSEMAFQKYGIFGRLTIVKGRFHIGTCRCSFFFFNDEIKLTSLLTSCQADSWSTTDEAIHLQSNETSFINFNIRAFVPFDIIIENLLL